MEKTLNFAVFKEKIIKTNELLNLLLERNKSLEKSQKWNQHLKNRLELSKNEVNKLKLKSETVTYNFTTVEKNYSVLKNEHEDLKEQFRRLENDSNQTINTLQLNYQTVNQELVECKQKLNDLRPQDNNCEDDDHSSSKKKKSPRKRKGSPVKNNAQNAKWTKTINTLQAEKEKLLGEKCDLKLTIFELEKEVEKLRCLQNDTKKVNKMEEELEMLKTTLKETVESKNKEIARLSQEIKDIAKARDSLQEDNERLKIENSMLQQESSESKAKEEANNNKQLSELENNISITIETKNKEITKLSKEINYLNTEKEKFEIENIKLKDEIQICRLEISNLHKSDKENRRNTNIQEQTHQLLPETPINNEDSNNTGELMVPPRERKISTTPTDEEISTIMKSMAVPLRISPMSLEADCDERSRSPFKDNSLPPEDTPQPKKSLHTGFDLKTIVNKRRALLKRKKHFARRKLQHVDLYGTLLALKKANIHFLISNNSLLPPPTAPSRLVKFCHPKNVRFKNVKKVTKHFLKQFNCQSLYCKNNYMVLNQGKEELLGFVDVKDEKYETEQDFIREANHDNFVLPKSAKRRKMLTNIEAPTEIASDFNDRLQIVPIDNIDSSNKEVEERTIEDKPQPQSENIEYENSDRSDRHVEKSSTTPPLRNNNKSPKRSLLSICKNKRKSPRLAVKQNRKVEQKNKLLIHHNRWYDCPDEETGRSPCFEDTAKSTSKKEAHPDLQSEKDEDFMFKKPISTPKSPKTTFKRPVCSIRRSLRLVKEHHENDGNENSEEETHVENVPIESPKSPTPPQEESRPRNEPVLIPLERRSESNENAPETPQTVEETATAEKMPTSKIESLFNKLIIYSTEEEALNEVVGEFSLQGPAYIAEAILERIAMDYHDKADTKYSPAPLMTDVQRTMLGFMSKLEKSNVTGVFESYLSLAEQRLLTCNSLQEFNPITRLYLAVCKLQKNLTRMRKLCCDVFYFCGELALPFFFTVLTSWTEVLPHAADAKDFPIARVLVQIVYTIDCSTPGYNQMPLRDLLIKFYGYPTERWDYNEFFKELLDGYFKNPSRSSDFALLLYCKTRPEKWVYEKIEEHLKPLVKMNIQDNFKATLIILIGNLYNRFSSKSEENYMPGIREWLSSLVTEQTPDVVKRCVYVSLNRLKKK